MAEDRSTLLAMANTDTQLVWARYNAMLVAESILLAFVGLSLQAQHGKPSWLSLGAVIAAVILAWLWWLLTIAGWNASHWWYSMAGRPTPPSPTEGFSEWKALLFRQRLAGTTKGDTIRHVALSIILLFLCGLGLLVAWHLWELWSEGWPYVRLGTGFLVLVIPLYTRVAGKKLPE